MVYFFPGHSVVPVILAVKPRSHRARRVASTRPHLAYLQVMHIHPAVKYVILNYVIVNDVISTGVVW